MTDITLSHNDDIKKVISFMSTVGAIIVPFIYVQYQMNNVDSKVEQIAKKLASTVQHVASIKIEEGRMDTVFSHIRYLTNQVKEQKQQIEYLTNLLKTQQRMFQDLVQQLEVQGINYVPPKIRFDDEKRKVEEKQKKRKKKKSKNNDDVTLSESEKSNESEISIDDMKKKERNKKNNKIQSLEDLGV